MLAYDLGSSLVTPSWLPLALVVVIGVVIVFLYRSMKHNIDRIEVPRRGETPTSSTAAPTSPTSPTA